MGNNLRKRMLDVPLALEYGYLTSYNEDVENKDVYGLTLHDANWHYKKFNNVRFTDVNFTNATLLFCKFIDCEFDNCYISGMDITYTEFVNCKITGESNFNNKVFKSESGNSLGVVWNGIDYSVKEAKIDCVMAAFESLRLIPRVNLLDTLKEALRLRNELCPSRLIDIRAVDFSSLRINVGDLRNITFTDCSFDGTEIKCSNMEDVKFLNCKTYPMNLTGIWKISGAVINSDNYLVNVKDCYITDMLCGDTKFKSVYVSSLTVY